ncbi:MAG: hypothetical protein Ct9H90mP24_4590 [Methanobacteriota archaeon]|nr:MAG: hypothetical protein Ct9H90mP24_4590 [Euryarchaeota archaeon]
MVHEGCYDEIHQNPIYSWGKLSVDRPPLGEARIRPPTVIPTVAFCIPLSIETVVALEGSRLSNFALW